MKELRTDKFDLLISSASEYCVHDEAKAFMTLDTAQVEDNPKLRRKIFGYRKSVMRANILKIACIAVLICLSLAFTACMFVPSIRTAIWNAFVQLYDDHAKISFGDETEPPETESVEMTNPDHIVDCVELTYCPEGYTKGNEIHSQIMYRVDYHDTSGKVAFCVSQNVIDGADLYVDNELGVLTKTSINHFPAMLVECHGEMNTYMLVWQDYCYRYTIYGTFDSVAELTRIAEGLH